MEAGRVQIAVALVLSPFVLLAPATAQDASAAGSGWTAQRWELGLRLDVVGADGEPANDVLGAGVLGRYRLSDRWRLGVALDHSPGFDVERPYEFLGLAGDPGTGEVDADGTSTALSVWLERSHARPGRRREWFWGAGVGLATVEVDDLVGPLAGGGTYDISQDVGTETLVLALGGLRLRLGGWALEAAARLDQHFTDWTATDRVSGRRATLDDYLVKGVHLGLTRRF